jgi:hypothetical protein
MAPCGDQFQVTPRGLTTFRHAVSFRSTMFRASATAPFRIASPEKHAILVEADDQKPDRSEERSKEEEALAEGGTLVDAMREWQWESELTEKTVSFLEELAPP